VLAHQCAKNEATGAFKKGHTIIARLMQKSPDNATLPKDLAWFEAEVITSDPAQAVDRGRARAEHIAAHRRALARSQ
jgi:hypothetical protein